MAEEEVIHTVIDVLIHIAGVVSGLYLLQVHKAEDQKYSGLKLSLRQEIGELREKLLGMISSNEQAPDMERLGREEFILDMEEHDRLQAEENDLIQQVKKVSLTHYPLHHIHVLCMYRWEKKLNYPT